MLKCVEEINESKIFKAYFSDNTTTKFGQTNPKTGTYIDHQDKELKKNYIKRHLSNASLKNNEYIIRSTGDVVSKLTVPKKALNSVLYPQWTKKHMVNIENKTGNPITEHKVDILDRLNPNMIIGKGVGHQLLIKNMRYK